MGKKLKILYLYSELVGYQIPILKSFVIDYNAEVKVISWDKKKMKPYQPPAVDGIEFLNRSDYNTKDLFEFTLSFSPDIIYVSGWMDKGYLYVTKRFKKKKIPIVTAFDDIWTGSLRQRIGSLIFPFYFKKFFSHAWVAGPFQFEFARRLGFKRNEIIFDMLCADTTIFNSNSYGTLRPSENAFLYVGNFRKIKGVDILIEAFLIYKKNYNGKWSLICVGNGELHDELNKVDEVCVYPFSSYEELVHIAKKARVLVLPSRHDQWGVVVHEFAALGMPLLLSENVGAKATFFINGFNGLLFKHCSAAELAKKMYEFSNMTREDISIMEQNSLLLSTRINIKTSTANFLSLIKNEN